MGDSLLARPMATPYPPRLELARTPTPLEPLPRVSAELGAEVWVKRDDLTGTDLSGNKIRKLEFLFADARAQGSNAIVTTGGVQSNHARATAILAARFGWAPHLLLRGPEESEVQGNLLLDRLVGARVRFVTPEEYARRGEILRAWAGDLTREGLCPYVIPEGGSDEVGSWGYARAMEELLEQMRAQGLRFDTLVHAVGSGGTSAGLVLGRKLHGFEGRILGLAVCNDVAYFTDTVLRILARTTSRYSLPFSFGPEDLWFDDRSVGNGYAKTRPEEVRHLVKVARMEGLLLDPVYTNKAFYGLSSLLRQDRRALGRRILFWHTGGIFGLFAQAKEIAAEL
jgi:D-cysteine desulfhydrase